MGKRSSRAWRRPRTGSCPSPHGRIVRPVSAAQWAASTAAVLLVLYLAFIGWLFAAGRRTDARALAGFVPDCVVLFRRLLRDPRLSRRRKLLLAALVVYLASPLDLVPDFIPVAGQLDDAVIVAVVLRSVLRGSGQQLVTEHWPGPESSLRLMLRLAAPARAPAS